MADPVSHPPQSDPRSTSTKPVVIIAIVAGALAVGAFWLLSQRKEKTTHTVEAPSTAELELSGKAYDKKEPLAIVDDAPRALAMVLDVHSPTAAKNVLLENAWLQKFAQAPLGRGFLGSWGAFFGSQQSDVGLAGSGLVRDALLDVVTASVADQPVRVVLFSQVEQQRELAPAVVVEAPATALTTSVAAMTRVLQRGGFVANGCPGDKATEAASRKEDGSAIDAGPLEDLPGRIAIARWLVADQPLYVAETRGRLVLARQPSSVVHAVCSALPKAKKTAGVDVELTLLEKAMGREADVLSSLLGLKAPRAQWRVDGARLVPVGFTGELVHPDRLAKESIPDGMKRAIPEDMPVVLFASMLLPEQLTADSLQQHWQGTASGKTRARTAAVLWRPRGSRDVPTDVALLWSDPSDLATLSSIFSGKNKFLFKPLCGQLAMASTPEMLSALTSTCDGTSPSLAFAKPEVVQGLAQPVSLGLLIDAGRASSLLLKDGHLTDVSPDAFKTARPGCDPMRDPGRDPSCSKAQKKTPAEIDDADTLLRELPRFFLSGTKEGSALAPRGFST